MEDKFLLTFFGDDFTGSTDVMETLALQGLPTALFLDPPSLAEVQNFELKKSVGGSNLKAIGVAGITRSLAPETMQLELERVLPKLSKIPTTFFQYKICSTLDSSPQLGNIGLATEIALKYFPSDKVPVVVGAPFLNRFVAFGNLFARIGQQTFRIDRHPVMKQHPSTPMTEGDIGIHLSKQTSRAYQNIDILHFNSARQLRKAFARAKSDHFIIFDTIENKNLHLIAQILAESPQDHPALIVGSSGISYGLARTFGSGNSTSPSRNAAQQILVVSGSCSSVSQAQIEYFHRLGAEKIRLDVPQMLSERAQFSERLLAQAKRTIKAGKSLILFSALGPHDPAIAKTRAALPSGNLSTVGIELADMTKQLIASLGNIRTVVVGGDTSGQVARALGIYALETAWPVAPGAPLCIAHSKHPTIDGLEIALKGGQNGREDYFEKVLLGS